MIPQRCSTLHRKPRPARTRTKQIWNLMFVILSLRKFPAFGAVIHEVTSSQSIRQDIACESGSWRKVANNWVKSSSRRIHIVEIASDTEARHQLFRRFPVSGDATIDNTHSLNFGVSHMHAASSSNSPLSWVISISHIGTPCGNSLQIETVKSKRESRHISRACSRGVLEFPYLVDRRRYCVEVIQNRTCAASAWWFLFFMVERVFVTYCRLQIDSLSRMSRFKSRSSSQNPWPRWYVWDPDPQLPW